jgi:hypothetical protein
MTVKCGSDFGRIITDPQVRNYEKEVEPMQAEWATLYGLREYSLSASIHLLKHFSHKLFYLGVSIHVWWRGETIILTGLMLSPKRTVEEMIQPGQGTFFFGNSREKGINLYHPLNCHPQPLHL